MFLLISKFIFDVRQYDVRDVFEYYFIANFILVRVQSTNNTIANFSIVKSVRSSRIQEFVASDSRNIFL